MQKLAIGLVTIILSNLCYVQAQNNVSVLECKYETFKIVGNDSIKLDDKIIRIASDKIGYWGKREGATVLLSIYDFQKSQHLMFGIYGNKYEFSLNDDRKQGELLNCKKVINSFTANAIIILPEEVAKSPQTDEQSSIFDTVYFDTSVQIVHYTKGGFSGFIDNGFGYLPIKTIRKILSDTDIVGFTIVTQLIFKKEVIFTAEEWATMLNNN